MARSVCICLGEVVPVHEHLCKSVLAHRLVGLCLPAYLHMDDLMNLTANGTVYVSG